MVVRRSTRRRARALSAAFAVGFALVGFSRPARAEPPAPLEWNPSWPQFRPTEIAATGVFGLGLASALWLYPTPGRNWEGGILFDDAVRNALRLETRSGRESASRASDVIYYTLATYPILVDAGVVAGLVHGNSEVAVQLLAMDLEAYAFAGAIALTAEKVGRVRPEDRGCQNDPHYSKDCGNDKVLNLSFMSGHTTIAFTGAGLMCAHHSHLPLYGGGAPDTLACVAALGAASTAGALRIMADKHYSTDVLLGAGVGLFAGYGLPTLLHYRYGHGDQPRNTGLLPSFHDARTGVDAVLAPAVGPGVVGLTLVGTF
jgi:membrane-associated phospholipid phosphatase